MYGQSPTMYFRVLAMAEAHRRLRAADADSASVTDIAMSCGFFHLGRFSGRYQQLFDELPHATLAVS